MQTEVVEIGEERERRTVPAESARIYLLMLRMLLKMLILVGVRQRRMSR
jgi:hypothetical protein